MAKSLININIAKVNRVRLSPTLFPVETTPAAERHAITHEDPPTLEDVHYSQLAAEFPLIVKLQAQLRLNGENTGRPLKLLTTDQVKTFVRGSQVQPDSRNVQLREIALNGFAGERTYTKEDALTILQDNLGISQERALNGLQMMVNAGMLEAIHEGNKLFLGGSTPF